MKKRILTLLLVLTMTLTMFTACGGNNTDSPSNTNVETEEQIEAALSEYQTYIDNLEDFNRLTLYKLDNSDIPACLVIKEGGKEDILFYINDKLYTYSHESGICLYSNGIMSISNYNEETPVKFIELRDGEFVEVAASNGEMTKTLLEGKEVSQEEFIKFYKSTTDETDYLNNKEYVLFVTSYINVEEAYKELIDTINNKVKNESYRG